MPKSSSILIKNVLLKNKKTHIYIEGNLISEIGKILEADSIIDGTNKAAVPGLMNSHTHAAMTLMRSYADDMKLHEWLQNKIWPLEAKMREEDVYIGSKLACLEMIKSGTTFFNDMYWHFHGTARAADELGIRAMVSAVFIDMFDKEKAEEQIRLNEKLFKESKRYSDRIIFALGPHAIYTVSEESLVWAKDFADKRGCLIHIHLSETEKEVKDCFKQHGCRPVEYLEKIGFLGDNVVACHALWLTDKEISIMKKHDVKIAHNPTSNMKLSSGSFKYSKLKKSGLTVGIGTDGAASNNNLDMFEAMKFASLLEKHNSGNTTAFPAREVFEAATTNPAKMFRLNCGEIKEGMLADLLLIDIKRPEMTPGHDLISDLVYAANGSCVDTTICNGKVLMRNRTVPGEEAILEEARKRAFELTTRSNA